MNQSFQNPKAVNKLIVAIPVVERQWQADLKKIRVSLVSIDPSDSRITFLNGPSLKKVRIKMMLNGLSTGIIKAPMVSPTARVEKVVTMGLEPTLY